MINFKVGDIVTLKKPDWYHYTGCMIVKQIDNNICRCGYNIICGKRFDVTVCFDSNMLELVESHKHFIEVDMDK